MKIIKKIILTKLYKIIFYFWSYYLIIINNYIRFLNYLNNNNLNFNILYNNLI